MNYCTIEDAWKNSDYITEQFRIYENPYEKKINTIENFENTDFSIDYSDNLSTHMINQTEMQGAMWNSPDTLQKNNIQLPQQIKSNNRHKQCSFTCDNFWEHLQTCSECRYNIRKKFSSKIVENIKNIILDNKDTLLVILVCLFILVFLNLLIKLFN
jgi:hypothetical protein